MARSDPLILIRIVAKRLQKRKRAQTIPKDVLRLAKNQTARDNFIARETVENDNDVINEATDTGEIEDIVLDDEGNVDMGLNI